MLEIALAIAFGFSGPALAWGPQGHRLASNISLDYLDPAAQAQVQAILGNTDIAKASVWADQMRGNPSPWWQDVAGAYHYVTVPPGRRYSEVGAPAKGDAVTALAEFAAILKDPASSNSHKQLALRFSIHIVQDLHQPLHVGNGEDRGGTRVWVQFIGKRENLHRVWDSGLLASAGLSDQAWLAHLRENLPLTQAKRWLQPDPQIWIEESATIRDSIYPAAGAIGPAYIDTHMPTVEQRLQQAGVRTASYLNALLAPAEVR